MDECKPLPVMSVSTRLPSSSAMLAIRLAIVTQGLSLYAVMVGGGELGIWILLS